MDQATAYQLLLIGAQAFLDEQARLQAIRQAQVPVLVPVPVPVPAPVPAQGGPARGRPFDDAGEDVETPRIPRRDRRQRRWWVRAWLGADRRLQYGHFDNLLVELSLEDSQAFTNYVRLPIEVFNELLHLVTPLIEKQFTNFREPISPGIRLATTLRHYATGEKYNSLPFYYRVSKSSLCNWVPEVSRAIVAVLKDQVITPPTTPQQWRAISDEFYQKWNVPHACGAIDGKHIRIRKPPRSGSTYHNYKGYFSIVLMALVDAQ